MTSPAYRPRLVLVDRDDRRRARLEALGRELGLRCAPLRAVAEAPAGGDPRACLVISVGPAEAGALAQLRAASPRARLIVAGADRGQAAAVQALRAGADDFVSLAGGDADLAARVTYHLAELRGERAGEADLEADAEAERCGLVGASRAIAELRAFLRRVAASEATALIAGETGAGKECAALMLHRCSRRAAGPLVALNCAAIPDELVEGELFGHVRGAFSGAVRDHPGKMRLADGGTLFLDEVGDLSAAAQAKLLRAIETREVHALGARAPSRFDARVIAATNRDLSAEVAAGRFREDLYYRLAVARIRVPPLRERREDVAPLARLLLSRMPSAPRLAEAAAAALSAHDWPGNPGRPRPRPPRRQRARGPRGGPAPGGRQQGRRGPGAELLAHDALPAHGAARDGGGAGRLSLRRAPPVPRQPPVSAASRATSAFTTLPPEFFGSASITNQREGTL